MFDFLDTLIYRLRGWVYRRFKLVPRWAKLSGYKIGSRVKATNPSMFHQEYHGWIGEIVGFDLYDHKALIKFWNGETVRWYIYRVRPVREINNYGREDDG